MKIKYYYLWLLLVILLACNDNKNQPEVISKSEAKEISSEKSDSLNSKKFNNENDSAIGTTKDGNPNQVSNHQLPMPMADKESMQLAIEAINGDNGMARYEAFKKLNFKSYSLRAERGDTLTKSLAWYTKLFPNKIKGYKANDVRMEYDTSGIFLFADIKRSYTSIDDRLKYVVCELYDYVELPQKNYTENAWVTSIFEIESETGYIRRIETDIPHVFGVEDYKSDTKIAIAKYNIGYRFTLVVLATHQEDTEFVKQIASMFDFDKLIRM